MSDELKPCRFCNGPAVPVKQFKNNVTCGDKHCPGCIVVQEPERWNHRPIEDALRARIKELEEMNQAMHPENAPKDCWPVVVYLPTAQDRDDLIAACGREKPAMKAHAAVYRKP